MLIYINICTDILKLLSNKLSMRDVVSKHKDTLHVSNNYCLRNK